MMPPGALDGLVARIALYPDPLLAQILAGATLPERERAAPRQGNRRVEEHQERRR
jgi:Protein of unknown function (DUF3300)